MSTKKSTKHKLKFLRVIGVAASAIFAGTIFYGTIMLVFSILTPTSTIYMRVLFGLGLIGIIGLTLDKFNSTSLTRFFHYTSISAACVILSIRIFSTLFPHHNLFIVSFIGATVTFAHILAILNPKIANLIRHELISPKTNQGRLVLYVSLALIPVIGFIASLSSALLAKTGNPSLAPNIIGVLSWLLALIAPNSNTSTSSPWEREIN
jgi:hypothetical protein